MLGSCGHDAWLRWWGVWPAPDVFVYTDGSPQVNCLFEAVPNLTPRACGLALTTHGLGLRRSVAAFCACKILLPPERKSRCVATGPLSLTELVKSCTLTPIFQIIIELCLFVVSPYVPLTKFRLDLGPNLVNMSLDGSPNQPDHPREDSHFGRGGHACVDLHWRPWV